MYPRCAVNPLYTERGNCLGGWSGCLLQSCWNVQVYDVLTSWSITWDVGLVSLRYVDAVDSCAYYVLDYLHR